MNSKILLLSIAVISVGLFAMPSTLSLFAGQHTFDTGANVSCQKCHQDIYDEISNQGKFGTSQVHTALTSCQGCHRTGNATNIKAGTNTTLYFNRTGLDGAHAAVTMECVGCHDLVGAKLNDTDEAHTAFYLNSTDTNSTILKGTNEACVACHTHTSVRITWRRPTGYNITVNISETGAYTVTFLANTSVNTSTAFGGNVSTG